MTTILNQYATEIGSIASYAKRINFDFATGNFDEMLKGWLEDGRKFQVFVQDNKTDFIRQVKKHI